MILGRFPLILFALLAELRKSDVDVVTFGQYMRPTKRHMKVDRYVEPAEFDRWKQIAEDMGFLYVAAGPLVRSSYKVGLCCYGGYAIAQFHLFSGRRILYREYPEAEEVGHYKYRIIQSFRINRFERRSLNCRQRLLL